MDLKEYILPPNTLIGGWYIPSVFCNDIITLFKDNKEHQAAGVVGPPLRIDPTEKISMNQIIPEEKKGTKIEVK